MSTNTNVGTISLQMVLNNVNFNRQIYNTANNSKNVMNSTFKSIGRTIATAFSVTQVTLFAKSCIKAANTFENSFVGLNSVVKNTGKNFDEAKKFLQDYIQDGLIPMNEAAASYKNLAIKGFSTKQIEDLLTVAKDTAAFGRQGSLSMGKAIQGFTEGLKNDLSMMVDNAGVTKNLSVMTKEYAASIGKTVNSLTEAEKVQAYYNGIMWESRFQIGDAKKLTETYSGKVSKLSASFLQLKITIGELLKGALYPVINFLNNLIISLNVVLTKFKNFVMDFFNLKKSLFLNDGSIGLDLNTEDVSSNVQNAIKGIGSSTSSAVEEIKKTITGLDDVNIINKTKNDIDDGETGNINSGGYAPIDNSNIRESNKLFDVLRDKFKPLQDSVNKFLSSLKQVKEFIKTLFVDLDTSFLEPFANFMLSEAGLPRLFNILTKLINEIDWQKLNESFNNFFKSLLPVAEFSWNALMDFYNNFLIPIAAWSMNSALNTLLECLTSFNNSINWEYLRESFNGLWKSLEPFAKTIGDGLLWFLKNVLTPISTFVIGDVVPLFLQGLSSIIFILNSVLQGFAPIGKWLFDNFLKPLAEWTGGLIIAVLQEIVNKLKDFSNWCIENQEIITNIGIVIGSFVAAWGIVNLAVTIQGVVTALSAFVTTGGLAATVGGALSAVIAFLTSPITIAVAAIGSLIAIGVLLYKNWEEVSNFCKEVWEIICNTISSAIKNVKLFFNGIINFFKENWQTILEFIVNPFGVAFKWCYNNFEGFRDFVDKQVEKIKNIFGSIKDFFGGLKDGIFNVFSDFGRSFIKIFSDAWEGVKNIFSSGTYTFSNIVSGIANIFKGIVNFLIDGINILIEKPFNKINGMLETLRNLSIVGVKPFTWIPQISIPQIPKMYAQGMGYFAPNKPQLVGIGDNRSQGEFILTERQLEKVINRAGNTKQGNNGNIILQNNVNVAGKRFYKNSTDFTQNLSGRAGLRTVPV